ncbi:MAG: efflux RND transporter periplasmic adaptor subunit [Saprospiraceae bacterium]
MSRKTIIILVAIIVLAVLAVVILGGRNEDGIRVFTTEVGNRTIQEKVSASGKVFPQTEVKISSDVSGEVVELYVEEGDSVVVGQLLAKIDADAFQSQVQRGVAQVNNSKAQVANSRAQLAAQVAQREQIEAQLTNAREVQKRNAQLRKEGVISQADFDLSLANLQGLEANYKAAASNIKSAEESIRAAGYGVESSEASLAELRTSLRRTTIYAPSGGVISLLNVEQGERVVGTMQMTGTEMMRIANLNAMEVRVEVSENDVPRVTLGDEVEVEIDAYLNRKFKGKVTQIANSSTSAATAAGAALNSDQVTNFEVRINLLPESYADLVTSDKPYPFRPGMSAGVEILTETRDQVLTVPIQCVTTREIEEEEGSEPAAGVDELEEIVFVISADTVRRQAVTTGLQDDTYIEILSGLAAGDKVVKGPYTAVSRQLKAGSVAKVEDEDSFYEEK